MRQDIEQFFTSTAFAIAGASANRSKFGNKVLRCYLQHNKQVYPLNPREAEIEGLRCFKSIAELPPEVKSLSLITPPQISEQLVDEAYRHGIRNVWMQPGAESALAIKKCQDYGINVIADGSCILVILGFHS
jgi:predicted CoA-binding protein